jgi:hypothetical protein
MQIIKGTIATEPYLSSERICFSLHRDDNGEIMSCMSAADYAGLHPTIGQRVFLKGEHKADFVFGSSPIFSFTGDDTTEVGRRKRAEWLRLARKWEIAEDGKSIPFGFGNRLWREFVALMQEGDELWEFGSGDLSWQNLAGRAGIAIVRNGEIFDCRVTLMN